MSGSEIFITGIGGVFPRSPNLVEFEKNLLERQSFHNKTNRWKYDDTLGIPNIAGEVPHVYFDDLFFGINKRLGRNIDPTCKLGYERCFEAIIDAGYHPSTLRGTPIGVFTTCGTNEFEQISIYTRPQDDGYSVMGLSRAMFANRISYFFDLTGPSCAVDVSAAAVHLALQKARDAILEETCDGALVVGSCISRFPNTSVLLKALGFISEDTLTRSFDAEGSGSVRGDGAVAFLLQRGDMAKRCYAKVLATGVDYVGPRCRTDVTLLSPLGMERFLSNLYRSNSIDPKKIAYLEADGSANKMRDAFELNAIDAALIRTPRREVPLPIGSVRSNVGHVDTVNGYAAVCKAIVAMESGVVAATLNYSKPNPNARGLVEGRMKVVDSNTPLQLAEDSVVAVNTLGLGGGLIGHTVLQANPRKQQQPEDAAQHLPRLVVISARTEKGAQNALAKIKAIPFNTHFYRLVQDVFSNNIRNYNLRGFVICPPAVEEEVPHVMLTEKRDLWFVYSGMGSQWAGMGTALMQLPVFAETIERLQAVLQPKGLDLKEIITDTSKTGFDNILKSFVGITSCQVALTNVLRTLGLVPAGIIGHSVGELGCAYADGCLTEEQAVLAAWARGVASNEATLIKGMMAAIGLGYAKVKDRLPPTIDVACHNSDSSCTLSGPAEDVKKFVEQLTAEGVFARAVNVSDIAYHSRYIQPAAPLLRQYLKEVIPEPKRRSDKWVTTSVPADLRETEEAQLCSAEYQTNNLLSPVLFEEGLKEIPERCLLIEVAPHGLLQAILKRALPDQMHVPLTQRGHSDPLRFLLEAIGKIALGGAEPQVSALYPDVSFPVPRGTPPLSQLIEWVHDETTYLDRFKEIWEQVPYTQDVNCDTPCMMLNQSRLYPLSEALLVGWITLSKSLTEPLGSYPLRFDNIYVHHWKALPCEGVDTLQAVCMPSMTALLVQHVREDNTLLEIMSCQAHVLTGEWVPMPALSVPSEGPSVTITGAELYLHLAAHGLAYSPKFHSISQIQMAERAWQIDVAFNGCWSSFMEAIMQVFFLRDIENGREVHLPKTIKRIEIDPSKFTKNSVVPLTFHVTSGILQGPGVYAGNFRTDEVPLALLDDCQDAIPKELQFVHFGETNFETIEEYLRVTVNIILEASQGQDTSEQNKLSLLQLPNGRKTSELCEAFVRTMWEVTGMKADVMELTPDRVSEFQGRVPVLVTGLVTLSEADLTLAAGFATFLVIWSNERLRPRVGGLVVLMEQQLGGSWLSLVRLAVQPPSAVTVLHVTASGVPDSVPDSEAGVILLWRGLPREKVMDVVAEVDSKPYAQQARLVVLEDEAAPRFSLSEPLYAQQLALNARVNVLTAGGRWGCWRTLPRTQAVRKVPSLEGVNVQYLSVNPLELVTDPSKESAHINYVGTNQKANSTRIMGVAQWLQQQYRPDGLLRWPVPHDWTAQDAASVPFVYSMAYFALQVKGAAQPGESILIHEGCSALGQAAIRVATQLGCSPIFTTVESKKQRVMLLNIFPQLEPAHVLDCDSFELRLRMLTRGKGVRLVFNALTEMQVSLRCLGHWGRMLHFRRDDMLAGGTIGSQDFLKSLAVFAVSGHELFTSSARDRAVVCRAVSKGLTDGVIQPIVGVGEFNLRNGVNDSKSCSKTVHHVDATLSVKDRYHCDHQTCYMIVGDAVAETLRVAAQLSSLGARRILVAVSASCSALARQRQRTLLRQHGTQLQLHAVRSWDENAVRQALQSATSMAPVHTVLVVAKHDVNLAALVDSALGSQSLVVLAEEAAFQLARLAEQRRDRNLRTACLVAPPGHRVAAVSAHLADLLSAATRTSATVNVLPEAAQGAAAEAMLSAWLPRSSAALAALGRALGSLGSLGSPRLRELPSLGPAVRHPRENAPLFVLPLFGVHHEQLAKMAARIYSPVVVVETPEPKDGLRHLAATVLEAILRCRPHGPYNLMGWGPSTVLALEVQRQLEAANKCGVLFLVHGDVGTVRQWARDCPTSHCMQEAMARKDALGEEDSQRGAQAITSILRAIANHESDVSRPFAGRVHVICTSSEDHHTLNVNDQNVYLKKISQTSLDNHGLALYVNQNTAHSQLAGASDLRQSAERACQT